ncbi:MAG: neuromedin U [Proteobacteria bacterium]|nr:neuromedin U [Pseudomonadota bacterium]
MAIFVAALSIAGNCVAEPGAADLARAVQNPVADLVSLPFQNNTNFNLGPEEETQNVLNVQPVWPISVSDDANLITRTIVPIISQPELFPGGDRENGIGDIQFTAFYSPKKPTSGGLIWGAGPVLVMDSATDNVLGSGKWSAGPSVVVLKMTGAWVIGGLFQNVWDFAGDDDRAGVNQFLMQPFINYNFPTKPGRFLSFSPIVTADWKASNKNTWTVPLGGSIGQIIRWGKQPINLSAGAFYNVEKPEFGADWTLRLQATFLFPKGR